MYEEETQYIPTGDTTGGINIDWNNLAEILLDNGLDALFGNNSNLSGTETVSYNTPAPAPTKIPEKSNTTKYIIYSVLIIVVIVLAIMLYKKSKK